MNWTSATYFNPSYAIPNPTVFLNTFSISLLVSVFARLHAALEQQPLLNSRLANSSAKRNNRSRIVTLPITHLNFELNVVYFIRMRRLTENRVLLAKISSAKKRSFNAVFKLKVVYYAEESTNRGVGNNKNILRTAKVYLRTDVIPPHTHVSE